MLNSYDHWSPLKEVIVGNCFNANIPALDLSFKLFFHNNSYYYYATDDYGEPIIRKQYVEELTEDVEGLVNTLESLDIKVFRPRQLNKIYKFSSPYWESTCVPALNVRDQCIVLGNELIETSPLVRCRYFENDLLKDIFYHYFLNGSKWTVMPKPIMTDNSFDVSEMDMSCSYSFEKSEFDCGFEMMIDGPQCVKFGKDILVNVSNRNHLLGFMWLKKHLEGRFRLHKLHNIASNHLDSYIVPLKAGVLLLREPSCGEQLPEPLKKWKIIYPPEPKEDIFPNYDTKTLKLTSKYIDCNVLSIDGDKIIVNSLYPEFIKVLEKNGFTPIPVRHRHRRIFGGGFHCFTLDTVRDGGQENYFE